MEMECLVAARSYCRRFPSTLDLRAERECPRAMARVVDEVVRELVEVFRRSSHKRAAHAEARPILEQVSRTPAFLREALEAYVPTAEALTRANYPVVAVPVALNPYFELVVNCWIPLPGHEAHISTKAIHHHGTMLLSTATIFGPGYEHWLFSRPRPIDGQGSRYRMELLEAAKHGLHHVAFVDAGMAHVPIYPAEQSITLALWSDSAPTTWKDYVKRIPLLKRRDRMLKNLVMRAGLAKTLAIKVVDTFDFYPSPTGFIPMKNRTEFTLGPNEDHLHSLFCVVQRTGNEHIVRDLRRRLAELRIGNHEVVAELADRLSSGAPIEGRLSAGHYGIAHANFTTDSIRDALRAVAS
jgi:hypothetical protein